jgi:hypothetical protein
MALDKVITAVGSFLPLMTGNADDLKNSEGM